jgi:NADH:ubiquinone oxidoreductase subunit E
MNARPSQHPPAGGGGRRRPPKTPKGRQVDLKALEDVQALLGDRPRRRDLLIEHLHLIQDKYGHLSAPHLVALAHEMKMALAEVYEVATFYAHFDVVKEDGTVPPPVTVRVCDSLSCAMRGAEKLIEELPAKLGRDVRATGSIEKLIAQTLQLPRALILHVGHIAQLLDTPIQISLDLIEHRTRRIARLPSKCHSRLLASLAAANPAPGRQHRD